MAGALPGDEPLAWSPAANSSGCSIAGPRQRQIFRIDLQDGRRTPGVSYRIRDPAAIESEQLRVVMSADGSKFVYGYHRHLSELYVAHGLR